MKKFLLLFWSMLVAASLQIALAQTANWTNVGPIPFPAKTISQVHGIGRCSQLKFHPSNASKMYTASASGGLWQSSDKGVNWTSIGTDVINNVQSASIAIDPTNDQIIYWGTGDANYYSSGVGVYKTTNGGGTWTLSNSGMGNKLVIELLLLPTDNQTIIAATNGGIYKSTNGGSSWALKSTATQMYDMVFKPGTNGQTVYATAAKGFYRSLDAGETWTQITSSVFVFGANGTRVAVSAANANVVYVGNVGAGTVGEIYKSTDGGSTFVNARSESTKFLAGYDATGGGQGNYNFDIVVNPADANEIYLCAHVIWRSTDAGSTWTQQQSSWAYNLHTDQHHILFDPYVTGQLWNANDGGIWSNTTQGTGAWTPKSDGLACTEIYHATTSNVTKQLAAIGTQDNGGFYFQNGTWYNNRGGDWPPAEYFDYSSAYVYSDELGTRKLLPGGSTQNLNLPYTASSSARSKYSFTPANTSIAYVVNTNNIYRCSNLTSATPSWTLIYTLPTGLPKDIETDPGNADVLYIIGNDQKAYRSDNATGAATFTVLTMPTATTNGGFLAPVKSSNVVFASAGNKLYRSADKGATWTDITTGFPSANINGLVADRFSTTEAVYASYSLGVYYRDNTKTSWINYSQGLPIIADITDLFYFNDASNQGVIRASYYGRGMWESPLAGSNNDITVSLTAPTNNATYTSPATVNLTATATAASGITKVEFYNGSTLLGTDATSPYAYTWTPVGAGTYSLTAVAYNTLGATKTSQSISITVNLVCSPLTGTAFGTTPAYAAGSEFDKAFDGNTSTFFDYNGANGGYTGIDLGSATVITGVRYYPRSGNEGRMNGGVFQGSNVANFSSGVGTLFTIPSTPATGWNEASVTNSTAYRYVRYLSPNNGYCNVAEIQFCGTSNQSPTVSITAPSNNAVFSTVPATVNITATASDPDGTISKVEFYNGATLLGSDNTSPYSYSWTGVGAGTYQITAKAYDNLNATATSSIITIIVGNQSPTVSITSPANGASFPQPATITINATASDPDGTISKVEFYNGTTLLGTSTSSPYTYIWTGVSVGNYQLTAKAYDNSTGIATSTIVSVSVGNQNPVVLITSPSTGSNFIAPGSITINALASDIDGTVSKVEFYNGTTLLSTDATSPYSYSWTGVALGTYTITAKAYDNSSATTTSTAVTVNVTNGCSAAAWSASTTYVGDASLGAGKGEVVSYNGRQYRAMFWSQGASYQPDTHNGAGQAWTDLGACGTVNSPPTTSITSPMNNATFTPPATIAITATATDADGTIAKVQFYQGTTLLGQSTTSPYTFNWTSVAAGTYQLTAVATDNSGNTGTSGQITVIVNQAPTVSITAPANNSVYTTAPASVNIIATASSSTGTISKVEFYNGATLLGTSTTSPYTYSWTNVASGTYSLTAKAYDNLSVTATSTAISIRVNQAPVVSITAPANNAVYNTAPAVVAITATASDADGTISKVEFYNGSTLLGTSTTNPYSYNWTNVASGAYALTAKAYDNNGVITTSSAVTIRVNTSPTVAITAPANNAVYTSVPATVNITATGADADGTISKVEFYNGTTLLGTSTTSPYTYNWTNVSAGTYSLTAKAYDNNGAITTSSAINIRVNAAPTVSISAPANNAVFSTAPAMVALTATASDPDGTISKVEFYNGATLLGTSTTSPYTYNWTSVSSGTYSLTAKAYDNNGTITTSSAISIRVNSSPNVSITAPTNNATYIAPATINITASASDPDGTISKVEFYNGATLLGTSTASPYAYNWTSVAAGTYTLTAKAYDNDGVIITSAAISVIVNANTLPTVSITSPLNNAVLSPAPATAVITATASDTDGSISKVEFYSGATLLGTATTSPYSYNWTNVVSGTYILTAKAYDNLNATTVSTAITLIVNGAPTVSITAPANNATYIAPASVSITATAADVDGTISKVEFYNGATLLSTSTTSPYTYNWSGVTAGTYALTAKAYDNRGAVNTSSVINITVNTPANQSPSISITSPANNATFIAPASVTINATATDPDGTIGKVEFYNGATLLGSDNTSPFSYSWTGVTAGTYSITAKAYDNLNATATSAVINVIVNNNNLPTVSITAPANNAVYVNAPVTVNITASATDADGTINKVEFYNGATLLGTSTTSPFTYNWIGVASGTYTLTAKAYDNLNATTVSTAVTVVVNAAPTVSITSPANNVSFIAPASITINATATDPDGTISKVEFYSGTTLLGSDYSSPYSYSWTGVTAGTYTITAKAYDNQNASVTSSVINITVSNNAAPMVSITLPANNATFIAPASITINATASDADGTINKVEFYNGATLLGTSISSPYTYTWSSVAAGTYTLTAKAYDNLGATTSAATSVIVNGNTAPVVSITSPANNATFIAPASITINATAIDADGSIAKVEFYNGTTLMSTSTNSPYAYAWSSVSAGTYSLTAKAYDNLGAVTTSSVVLVNVNSNAAPSVSITSPANNAKFTAPANITFTASATDVDGSIVKVEFYNGSTLIGTSTTSPYTTSSSNIAAGTYTITALAYDNLGAITVSTPITIVVNGCSYAAWTTSGIYVKNDRVERSGDIYEAKWWTQNNDPLSYSGTYDVWKLLGPCGSDLMPSMTVTSTAAGTTMASPATFSIDVTTHDDEGSVSKVEFYSGTNLVSQGFTGIESYTFTNLPLGTYEIYVKVYDNAGNVAVSDTLRYTIQSVTSNTNPLAVGKLNLYPNPVTGNDVTFDYPANANGQIYIAILDVSGKQWFELNENDNTGLQKTINVDFLPPGAYIVKLRISDREYHEKLVKPSKPKMK